MQIQMDSRSRGIKFKDDHKRTITSTTIDWYTAHVDNIPTILLYCHALSSGKSPPSHRGMYRRRSKRRKSIEVTSKSTGRTRCGYTRTFKIEREETEDRLTKHYQNRQRIRTQCGTDD